MYQTFKAWLCNNGEECGGHQDGGHGRGHAIEAGNARRAAEEAGREFVGPFGDVDERELLSDGARVHVVDPDGAETTWAISARISIDATATEWRPWTAAIQWLPEPLLSVALKARLFAYSRKAIVLDGVTWVSNGHVLVRVAATPPDGFERLPPASEAAIREMIQPGESLTEQRRFDGSDTVVVEFCNGSLAAAEYVDTVASAFPGAQWFRSKHVDLRPSSADLEDDPPFVAVANGEAVAVVMPRVRAKSDRAAA